jgi:hypothetical protein
MKIIYNPKDGAPIIGFIFDGKQIAPHYPDRYEYQTRDGRKVSNGLMQYSDSVAEEALERFGFLQLFTEAQAKELLARPEKEYKCEEPGCDFVTATKVALIGHGKSHKKDAKPEEAAFDPTLIPVADSSPSLPLAKRATLDDNEDADIQNGPDKDGVDWYGDGAVVQNKSTVFGTVSPNGKGHFVG